MGVLRARALVAAFLAGLTLAGCGDPQPKLPDPTPTPTSSTPTVSDSGTPTPETAEQFIRRWVELSNQMQNTGSVRDYLSVSRRCEACVKVAKRVKGIYAAGGYVHTEGWVIVSIKLEGRVGERRVFRVVVDSRPTEYMEAVDASVERLSGGQGLVERLEIATKQGSWEVVDLAEIAS